MKVQAASATAPAACASDLNFMHVGQSAGQSPGVNSLVILAGTLA